MKFPKAIVTSVAIMILPLIALLIGGCGTSNKQKLYIYTWSEIFDPALIAEFETKFDCKVIIDIFDTNESMYAKLKLTSAGYDIICPSHYFVSILAQQKMIQALDSKLLPDLMNLDPKYFTLTDPLYAVPYIVSFSGIGYRQDKINEISPSYGVFGRVDLRGRMTMLNDSREAIGAALKYLGYSVNSREPKEIEKAGDLLIQWKKNLAKFESEQYKSGLSSGEFLVVQGYSTDILQVQSENKSVVFLFPSEGVITSIDCLSIPEGAQNTELAYKFINFMIGTEVAAQNIRYAAALSPVASAYPLLGEDIRNNPIYFPPKDVIDKMERIEDLQGDVQYYYKTWDRVKAS
ncbi:MAG: spermidine/putrescine ABC transporter substrate-binding protein [Parachlamydiaceae bacterium]|nr:spermidine/putrescine ABC transporter substrate-binding protein [Parachlamydiaceae bacterium]